MIQQKIIKILFLVEQDISDMKIEIVTVDYGEKLIDLPLIKESGNEGGGGMKKIVYSKQITK